MCLNTEWHLLQRLYQARALVGLPHSSVLGSASSVAQGTMTSISAYRQVGSGQTLPVSVLCEPAMSLDQGVTDVELAAELIPVVF